MAWPFLHVAPLLLVCVRERAALFDGVSSYESSSAALPGEVFLATAAEWADGFCMVAVDAGALESRFVRLASSKDLQVNPGLIVLDLDCACALSALRRKKHLQGWSLTRPIRRR